MTRLGKALVSAAAGFRAGWEALERPTTPISDWDGEEAYLSDAGEPVTAKTAMRLTAVFSAIRLLSETIAALPLPVYERTSAGGKRRVDGHPLSYLLNVEANPRMTAYTARTQLGAHLCGYGNSFSRTLRSAGGEVTALWPLEPPNVLVDYKINVGIPEVKYRDKETGMVFRPSQFMHIPGLAFDGVLGLSPIGLARESLGVSIAAERFAGRFFGNSAMPSGMLTTDSSLKPDEAKELRTQWEQAHGRRKARGTAVLHSGLKYQTISISNADAQFLETRKFQVSEIARLFRVPPHMIGDLDRATFSNIEHQSLELVQYTFTPWLVSLEQAINRHMFPQDERGRLYVKHDLDELLRGDLKTRMEAHQIGVNAGIISPQEARQKEDMNPVEGLDYFMRPMNMAVVGEQSASTAATEGNTDE